MALETVNNIQDLVITNPIGATDPRSEGDDHIRNIKKALKTDLPNITGPITATQAELNLLDGIGGAVVSTTDTQTITNKTLTSPTVTLKQGTTPTAEGDIQWDATNNALKIGDSAATQTFSPDSKAGRIVQVVHVQDGAVATGTGTIPSDDTIPQNTEGAEFITLSITPTSATNKLKVDVVVNYASSITSGVMTSALFVNTAADALAAVSHINSTSSLERPVAFSYYGSAGGTSATTFKIRIGNSSASTTTFNGQVTARLYGGVVASTITITEIQA